MSHSPSKAEDLAAADEFRASWRTVLRLLKAGQSFSGNERDCFFMNTGGSPEGQKTRQAGKTPRFAEISAVSGFDSAGDGRGVAVVDWDQDGDMDLWLTSRTGPQLRFYRNDAGNFNHFVALKLEGDSKTVNRDGIGARVEIVLKDQPELKTIRTLRAGEGFISQTSKWVNVGLGKATAIDKVIVRWPGGATETFAGAEADKRYRLVQGAGKAELWTPPARQIALKAQLLPESEISGQARMFMSDRYPMPRVEFKTLDSKQDSLSRFKGKPVLLNLWASWCTPCVQELGEMTREEAKLRAAGVQVLALSLDEHTSKDGDGIAKAKAALERLKFPFDAGLADRDLHAKLETFHNGLLIRHIALPVPTSFLLDGKGRLAVVYRGKVAVDQLLADVKLLDADPRQWFELSLPFPGISYGRPGRLGVCDILLDLVESRRFADVAQYIDDHGALIAARHQAGMDPRLPRLLYSLAVELESRRELGQAIDRFQQAIDLQPKFADARFNLAMVLAKAGRKDSAFFAYKDLLELDPKHFRALNNLGLLFAGTNRHKLACEHYQRALALIPDNVDVLNNWGNSLVAMRDTEAAIGKFQQALKLAPEDGRTHFNLGVAYEAITEPDKAIAAYVLAVKYDPKNPVAHNNLGVACAKVQRYDEAEKHLKNALNLDPEYPSALKNLKLLETVRGKKPDN